ncbi:SUN domain-containing protein 1 [Sinocyclocheilus anshuiensis]|uniref:SUN domain-containing protein 1 n=1 Tax=Sinocyclocheilus anshuiensis TaxID=1608454 RepID=UPI0007BA21A8|nr:PREDICTED: SUN domain-containing protein 1-like [Sinocyclocheilus anshuiensis]
MVKLHAQRITMDFSPLHTYTPPHCTPDNTGYTYSLSSSYSTAALDFEKEHQINPVYDSPRMSRRSLRLQTSSGFYGDNSLTELTGNHSVGSYKQTSTTSSSSVSRAVRSRRQQQSSSVYESQSMSQIVTPTAQKDQTLSDLSFTSTASDASLISSLLDQSTLRQSSTAHAYSAQRRRNAHSSLLENGDISKTEAHTNLANGYICKDCSFHADGKEDEMACSLPYSTSVSSAYQTAEDATMTTSLNSVDKTAHDSYCGSVNVRDLVTTDSHLNLNGSLCDDCKGKQHMEMHTEHKHYSYTRLVYAALWALVSYTGDDCKGKQHMEMHTEHKRYSYTRHVYAALWALVSYTGYGLLRVCRGFGSAGAFVTRKLKSVLWLAVCSPGKAATGAFWWLGTGWYQLVALMSLINVFLLTRCLPKLLKLLLFLLPLLLLFGLWYLGPPIALSFLPAVNFTELKTAVTSFASLPPLPSLPSLPSFPAFPSFTKEPLVEEQHIPPPVISQAASESINSERLARLEQRVAALWESIQQGELKAKQQHEEAVGLVQALQDQMNTRTDRESLSLWVSQLLEPKFTTLKGEIEREAVSRAETEEQHVQHQTSLEARLAELELLLKNLNSRTEEIHLTQQTPVQAPVSVGVSQEKHDALLSEVQRLEAELSRIRGDLQGVMGCKGKCDQLDTIHETVSAQVKEQLYVLLYGRDGGEAEIPEPLLPWLASQYMRSSDLTATLMTLERSILGNLSLQLQESKQQQFSSETVTQTVAHTAGAAGISEEQVQLIVQRALKLYSEDRTGQVDYALESGGGSILSTRCSETYETKTALMSLFGIPLWYFSQSPRVVIQPDMYPGNCWAFKGSQGYLVIRLSLSMIPTSFCLEHIPKSLSPSGNISSAPRRFSVYGLDDEYQEEGKLLGDYTYQEDGESIQTFPVMEKNDKAFQIIEMRVLSNWGHPEYTCLYRFRVHGKPHTQ